MIRNSITIINILVSACAFIFLTGCNEKQYTSDTGKMNLQGSVRSINEQYYYARNQFDLIVLDAELYHKTYEFDNQQRYTVVTHENVFLAAVKQDHTKAVVLPDSLQTDRIEEDYLLSETDSITISILAENKHQNINQLLYANEPLTEIDYLRKEYNYTNDSTYSIKKFNKGGIEIGYDNCLTTLLKQAKLINSYSDNEKLSAKIVFTYDKNKLTNHTVYFENTLYETFYSYPLWRKKESYSYTANLRIHSYNWSGLLSKTESYSGNQHSSVIYYKYDKLGNLSSQREEFTANQVVKESTFHYRYDAQGNWTERIERRNDGNTFVTKRSVQYF